MATANKNLSDFAGQDIPDASEMKFGIVVAEWNEEITGNLLNGAYTTLRKFGCPEPNISVHAVPGSFELPLGAQFLLESTTDLDAVICVGSVIRGETSHFDLVCQAAAMGIKDVGLKYNKPVIFGVLTDDHIDQSRARSGGALGNKGDEAAVSAIKMVAYQKSLD